MAEEVSSIGVKLTLNASGFMSGMTAATEKTDAFVAAAKEAATVAGAAGGGTKTTSRSSAAQNVGVNLDINLSAAQITKIREQIIKGIGVIPITVTPQIEAVAERAAKRVTAAQVTPAAGSRGRAATIVESNVSRNAPKRAMGGPVWPGQDFIVGERRAEVFRPRTTGSIHPDASRYYREQEAQARREASDWMRHQERMSRISGRRDGGRATSPATSRELRSASFALELGSGPRRPQGQAPYSRSELSDFYEPPRSTNQGPIPVPVVRRARWGRRVAPAPVQEGWDAPVTPTRNPLPYQYPDDYRPGRGPTYYEDHNRGRPRPPRAPSPYPDWDDYRRQRSGPVKTRPSGYRFPIEELADDVANVPTVRVGAQERRSGKEVGKAFFVRNPEGRLHSVATEVRPQHQGKGVASWMYAAVERYMGEPVVPSDIQYPQGQKLWASPSRPFGSQELLPPLIPPGQMGMFGPAHRPRRRSASGRVRPSRSLEARAFRMFGETDEISEAGYISPSGRMLDFSGRHEAGGYRRDRDNRNVPEGHGEDWLGYQRNVDHRQAWPLFKNLHGPDAMERMMQRGFVRVFSADAENNQFMGSINKPLTAAQQRTILGGMWDPDAATGILDVHKRMGRKVEPFGESDLDYPETPLRRVIAQANAAARRRMAGGIIHARNGIRFTDAMPGGPLMSQSGRGRLIEFIQQAYPNAYLENLDQAHPQNLVSLANAAGALSRRYPKTAASLEGISLLMPGETAGYGGLRDFAAGDLASTEHAPQTFRNGLIVPGGPSRISLHRELMRSTEAAPYLRRKTDEGYYASMRSVGDLFTHEMGHAVDANNELFGTVAAHGLEGLPSPSKYAGAKPHEVFAEQFGRFNSFRPEDRLLVPAEWAEVMGGLEGRSHGGPIRAEKGLSKVERAAMQAETDARTYDTFSRLIAHQKQSDPKKLARSLTWYQRQRTHLDRIAKMVGLPERETAAIVAEISSNNPWPNNALDVPRLFPDSWRRDPSKKLSSPMATGKNKDRIWEILKGGSAVGIKKSEFMDALLGRASARPADVWMARLSRIALPEEPYLPERFGADFDSRLTALHGPTKAGEAGWRGGIQAHEIRSIHAAIDRVAKETGYEPRGIQAALWDIIRDRSIELGITPKKPHRRVDGGDVESFFHATKPYQGFVGEAFSTAAGWAKDPFMAFMAWQGQQGAKKSSRGRRDVVGKPRLGRDFAGKPMAVGIPPWIFHQLGPEGLAGAAWQDAMSREDQMAFFARFAGYIPENYRETWGEISPAIPWVQDEKFVKAMGEQITYDRQSRPKVHRKGGPVRAARGAMHDTDLQRMKREAAVWWDPRHTPPVVDPETLDSNARPLWHQVEQNRETWSSGFEVGSGYDYLDYSHTTGKSRYEQSHVGDNREAYEWRQEMFPPQHPYKPVEPSWSRYPALGGKRGEPQPLNGYSRYRAEPHSYDAGLETGNSGQMSLGFKTEVPEFESPFPLRHMEPPPDLEPFRLSEVVRARQTAAEDAWEAALSKKTGKKKPIKTDPATWELREERDAKFAEEKRRQPRQLRIDDLMKLGQKRLEARLTELDAGPAPLPEELKPLEAEYQRRQRIFEAAQHDLSVNKPNAETWPPAIRKLRDAASEARDKLLGAKARMGLSPLNAATYSIGFHAPDSLPPGLLYRNQPPGHTQIRSRGFIADERFNDAFHDHMAGGSRYGMEGPEWKYRYGHQMYGGERMPVTEGYGGLRDRDFEDRWNTYGSRDIEDVEARYQQEAGLKQIDMGVPEREYSLTKEQFEAATPEQRARKFGYIDWQRSDEYSRVHADLYVGETPFTGLRPEPTEEETRKASQTEARAEKKRLADATKAREREARAAAKIIAKRGGSVPNPEANPDLAAMVAQENDPTRLVEDRKRVLDAGEDIPRNPAESDWVNRADGPLKKRIQAKWDESQASVPKTQELPARTLRGMSSMSAFGPWHDTPLGNVDDMSLGHYLEQTRAMVDLGPETNALYRARRATAKDQIQHKGDTHVVDEIGETFNLHGSFTSLAEARAAAERKNAERAAIWKTTHAAAIENVALMEAEVARRGLTGSWRDWSHDRSARTVPQHEAPEVTAHAKIAEEGLERRAERAEAFEKTHRALVAASTPGETPSLLTVRRRTRDQGPTFEEKLGVKIPWLKRAAGGDAGDGLYIVNEIGPEAFIEQRDVRKLAARRPDIYSRIPGAADGARTGMIQKPAWSLFAPQKDGLIVRREDAHEALNAVRADRGASTADEDLLTSRGPVVGTGQVYPPMYGPPAPLVTAPRRTRDEGMQEFTASLRRATDAVGTFGSAANRGQMAMNEARASAAQMSRETAGGLGAGTTFGDAGETMADAFRAAGIDPDALRAGISDQEEQRAQARRDRVTQNETARREAAAARGGAPVSPSMYGPGIPIPTTQPAGEQMFAGEGGMFSLTQARTARQAVVSAGLTPSANVPPEVSAGIGAPTAAGPAEQAAPQAGPQEARTPRQERRQAQQQAKAASASAGGKINPREGQWGRHAALAAAMQQAQPGISNAEIAEAIGIPFQAVPTLSKEGVSLARHREKEAEHIISRERDMSVDPVLAKARIAAAGSGAWMTERTPKGAAAVLGALGLGGGAEFKRKQQTYQLEAQAYNASTREVQKWEKSLTKVNHKLADSAFSEEDRAILLGEQKQIQDSLAVAEGKRADQAKKFAKAEKDIEPTTANVVKSFGSIIFATSAYGAAFAAANTILEQAVIPGIQKWADQMLGFTPMMTKVTGALADSTRELGGNYKAAIAAKGVSAGMAAGTEEWSTSLLGATVVAKTGAKAYTDFSEIFRSSIGAMNQQGTQGLFGGYGGIMGTPLLGEQLGGGKGLQEQMLGDILASRGQTGVNLLKYFGAAAGGAAAGGMAGAATFTPFGVGVGAVGGAVATGGGLAVADILSGNFGSDYDPNSLPKQIEPGSAEAALQANIGGAMGRAQGRSGGAGYQFQYRGATANELYKNADVPQAMKNLAESGYAVVDANNMIVTSYDAVAEATEQLAEGLAIPDVKVWAQTVERQLNAQFQAMDIASVINREMTIPLQFAMQRIASPLMPPGAGVVPGAGMAEVYGRNPTWEKILGIPPMATKDFAKFFGAAPTTTFGKGDEVTFGGGMGLPPGMSKLFSQWAKDAEASQKRLAESDASARTRATGTIMAQPGAAATIAAATPEPVLPKPQRMDTSKMVPGGTSTITGKSVAEERGYVVPGPSPQPGPAPELPTLPLPGSPQIQTMTTAQPKPEMYGPPTPPGMAEAKEYNALMDSAQAASNQLKDLQASIASLSAAAAQASWANTTRLALRSISDAAGLLGQAGGSTLGRLQRHLWQIGRASQALDLALQQRQITTQIALAGFQAPGETGEERYARQKEQLALAAIQQKKLGYAQETYTGSGQEWKIQAQRNLEDAQAAWAAAQKAHTAEMAAADAQATIAALSAEIAADLSRADDIYQTAAGKFGIANSTLAEYARTFGGTIKDANASISGMGSTLGAAAGGVRSFLGAMGFTFTAKKGGGYNVTAPTFQSAGYMGRHAEGYLGNFGRGATFTVGEAGPETVAILRNPRTHMLQNGGSGEGGGGGGPVTININGPVVRDDRDISKLARAVADEVERSLSHKGQLLGLRSPAY